MKKFLNTIKKSEIAVYTIAIMLVAAGYLNYSTINKSNVIESSVADNTNSIVENTSIGDAILVNSDNILEENLIIDEGETEEILETNNKEINYFTESKLNRDTSYASMISNYTIILEKDNVSKTEKQIAMQEITKINNTKNAIMICENLLSTKGFENNVVFVNNESINVVVKVNEALTKEKVAQIQNIISRELNAEISNIHITEK